MSKELKNKENLNIIAEKPEMKLEVNGTDYPFLPKDTEQALDDKIQEIRDFMANNDGKGKSDEEKDALYAEGQKMWGEFSTLLNDAKFGLILNKPQYIYMTNLLLEKMEYDVNLLFFAIELTNMLGNMKNMKDEVKYTNDVDPISFELTATDITYLYHVLQQHKVKGLGDKAYTFANIIRRIGDISKVFSHYDNESKDLSTAIQDWVRGFEDNVEIAGKTIEPVESETE